MAQHDGANATRTGRHDLEVGRLRVARDEIEDSTHIARDHRIAREEGQVRVDAGRLGMIVAGSDVAVRGELRPLAPHDEPELGVGFQLDEAVDDVHARAFQIAGEANVVCLVEPRF